MKKRILNIGFVVLAIFGLAIPFLGLPFVKDTATAENRELKELPAITLEDGRLNTNYMKELGAWFGDHFALRSEMIEANSFLDGRILRTSSTEKVILGSDDWLFYRGTIGDYEGTDLLSDRALFMIAHNVGMMKNLAEMVGAQFYYTIVPNKNTLYDEHMPARYQKGTEKNMDRIVPYLAQEGIAYIDLKTTFAAQDEVLYLKGDSHWTNKGAVLAYNIIMDAIGKPHETYEGITFAYEDYIGDLNEMHYGRLAKPEKNEVCPAEVNWRFTSEAQDVTDSFFTAMNENAMGSLYMYRDSFGNTLFPLMAHEFGSITYTKLEPYSVNYIFQNPTDYVILERVERNIASVIKQPPILPALSWELVVADAKETRTEVLVQNQEGRIQIDGVIDPDYLETDSRIYVSVGSSGNVGDTVTAYEACGLLFSDSQTGDLEKEDGSAIQYGDFELAKTNADAGFCLYLTESALPEGSTNPEIAVYVSGSKGVVRVF